MLLVSFQNSLLQNLCHKGATAKSNQLVIHSIGIAFVRRVDLKLS